MSNLVIVESPTKAKTLSKFLGSNYRIEATMGHVRDLPVKKLGIEIKAKNKEQITKNRKAEYEFIPKYQVIAGRKERITQLKNLAENSSSVILATDPDREGEAIAWHVKELLKKSKRIFKRIVFHEITESAIKLALQNTHDIDIQLVDAQQARRILDRLVGYKLSPLLWNKLGKRWLSAGRVQSVAVRMIVEREREILAFNPQEYWVIDMELQKINGVIANEVKQSREIATSPSASRNDELIFLARLEKINDKKVEIKDKNTADAAVSELKEAFYKVSKVEVKDSKRFPMPPFTTSTLQQAAANKFGWTAKRTMKTAQNLYEEGHITYHRTDSTNLASEAIEMVRNYIYNVYGKPYLPEGPKFYKTKSKVAQEAHEAIRPTNVGILGYQDTKILGEDKLVKNNIKQLSETLGRDADILYSLIWKRFVACQMREAVAQLTNVEVEAMTQMSLRAEGEAISNDNFERLPRRPSDGGTPRNDNIKYLLKAQGERMKFDGWTVLYGEKLEKELPQLATGENLNLLNILPQQKFTEPKGRYTESTLIKTLEEKGIGRPSTYAPIISTIQDRKYVEKIERKFAPTDLGFAVNDFLVKYFPDIFDAGFTAKMENDLDEIANGKMEWNSVIGSFYIPLKSKIDAVFKDADRVKVDLGTTDEKCEKCGSILVYRLSKFGKFLACSNYPECKFTKNVIEKAGIPCPKCGTDIIVKKTRRGKQFYGCGNYPKCTFAAWKKEDVK